jgi:hypothetical protein
MKRRCSLLIPMQVTRLGSVSGKRSLPWRFRYTVEVLAPREGASFLFLIQDRKARLIVQQRRLS